MPADSGLALGLFEVDISAVIADRESGQMQVLNRRSGTSSATWSRPITLPLRKILIAPSPSGSCSPARSSSNESIGDHLGQLAPTRSSAYTVDYLAANGAGEISLRQLAAAIGTSHRMLIYYFGSKRAF